MSLVKGKSREELLEIAKNEGWFIVSSIYPETEKTSGFSPRMNRIL